MSSKRAPSLQRRLLWLVGLPVVVLWLAAGAWLGQRTAHETAEMFDRELQRTAASVLAALATVPEASLPTADLDDPGDDEGPRGEIVVRDRGGRLLLDASVLPPLPAELGAPHFHTIRHGGERWRVYQRWDAAGRHWIQVAAPLHDRDELLGAHIRALLVPLAGLLVLLPLATWLGLRLGLAPLRALSRAIAAQPARPPTLTRDDVPAELRQLTRALDALVAKLDSALARERRFTADAAHELRHPLSVLRMELDLAGAAGDDAGRAAHLQRARDGLQRMERLVAQLLTLARVESLEHLDDATMLSPATLAREVLATAGERAAPRGIVLSLRADEAARVRGSAGLLAIALGNLVDNAIAHGLPRGQVAVGVARDGGSVDVVVDDDGPGIAEAQAARLGERFLRGAGSGNGLGLSIAQAIATLHGGALSIGRSPAGGARVVLRLPAAAGAEAATM
ncbi:MAG TPA: ATP-binding protein [Xanthomonadaceae bacterium]|nr:ATP-binding protein [Xanthomonadaceae bacterium]